MICCFHKGRQFFLFGSLISSLITSKLCDASETPRLPDIEQFHEKIGKMRKDDLKKIGEELRQFFKPYIERANGNENWKFNITLNEEAKQFFPVGMDLDDAAEILNFAGFHILPRPLPREDKFQFWLMATLSFPNRFIYKTYLGIQIEPTENKIDGARVKSCLFTVGVN